MEYPLYNQKAENIGKVDLPDRIFNLEMNSDLVHQIVTSQRSNKRQVIAHAKGRGEVRGGGKKPWRQKGTGRARHGSTRSPIWVGGGITFGPTSDRNFKEKINKKMKRKALLMTLSDKITEDKLIVLDHFAMTEYKTSRIIKMLKHLPVTGSLLFIIPVSDSVLVKSASNIPKVSTTSVSTLNIFDVIKSGTLLTTSDGLKKMHEFFSAKGKKLNK